MTKPMSKIHQRVIDKGAARKAHDDIVELLDATVDLQKNDFWDVAQASYKQIKEATDHGLMSVIGSASALAATPLPEDPIQAEQELRTRNRVAVLLTTLNADTKQYYEQLDAIHAKHADKHGATRGADDHALLIGVQGAYADTVAKYHAAANTLVNEIQLLSGDVAAIEAQEVAKSTVAEVGTLKSEDFEKKFQEAVLDVITNAPEHTEVSITLPGNASSVDAGPQTSAVSLLPTATLASLNLITDNQSKES